MRAILLCIATLGCVRAAITIEGRPPAGTPAGNATRTLDRFLEGKSGDLILTLVTGAQGRPESFSLKKSAGPERRVAIAAPDSIGLAYGVY